MTVGPARELDGLAAGMSPVRFTSCLGPLDGMWNVGSQQLVICVTTFGAAPELEAFRRRMTLPWKGSSNPVITERWA